jgi:hypothetical protein
MSWYIFPDYMPLRAAFVEKPDALRQTGRLYGTQNGRLASRFRKTDGPLWPMEGRCFDSEHAVETCGDSLLDITS